MRKTLKYMFCLIICSLFIFCINVQADTIENIANNDSIMVMNIDNAYNSVSTNIAVLNKEEKTTIEVFDFITLENDFKLENYNITMDTDNVIEIVNTTILYEGIAKITMDINAKSNGIANMIIEKDGKKCSYTIIVVDDKNQTFNGYVVENDNTFCVHNSDFESQITEEMKERAWKISINAKEYKEEFLGKDGGESDDDGLNSDDSDGAVTPGENEQDEDDNVIEEQPTEEENENNDQNDSNQNKDKTPTKIPQAGEIAIIPGLIVATLIMIYSLIMIIRKNHKE